MLVIVVVFFSSERIKQQILQHSFQHIVIARSSHQLRPLPPL